ncbi:MAG: hypothetical protein ACP5PM_01820 [Acidimicrobiales bacterium]
MFGLHALLGPAVVLHEHGGDVTAVELACLAAPFGSGSPGRPPSAGAYHATAVGMLDLFVPRAVGEWIMVVAGFALDVLGAEAAVGFAG